MKYLLPKLVLLIGASLLVIGLWPVTSALAFEPVSDCVIRDFASDITLNKDSSLNIQEDIAVDCGKLPDKHGIFRILPTKAPQRLEGEFADTRINLISITDDKGSPLNYTTITNKSDHTLTWKIGDADILISGLNHYRIKYTTQNAVTMRGQGNELYWNINGNFWQLPSDKVSGTIHFPAGINQTNIQLGQFVGQYGENVSGAVDAKWKDPQTLVVISKRPLNEGDGITIQADFPDGVVALYTPSFWEKYALLVQLGGVLLIWLIVFLWAYTWWRRQGKDFGTTRPVTAEFSPPENLGPFETEAFASFAPGNTGKLVSATIVDMAVRGWITIEEIPAKFLSAKDWTLTLKKTTTEGLRDYEQMILEGLFGSASGWEVGDTANISDQRNKFYKVANAASLIVGESFYSRGWSDRAAKTAQLKMLGAAGVIIAVTFFLPGFNVFLLPIGIGSALILFAFGALMPRRTTEGAEVLRLIKGFKLYMSRAEKYREQFYEKENIFEKYLPYAIAFGLTGLWVKAFRSIYGQQAVASYMPLWYVGGMPGASFDIGSFESNLNSLSSQIGSTLTSSPSSSGSGGGGFSGGGGGGGGGGSW